MALIELKCEKCGKVYEELLKSDGNYPPCKFCGGKTEQVYSGKLYVGGCKKSDCTGDCSCCGGCH